MGEYLSRAIVLLFFWIFSLAICKLIKGSEKDSDFERELYSDSKVQTFSAKIIKRFHKDTTYYIVRLVDGNKTIEARTVLYKQVREKYKEGDTVLVKYYITEGGDPKAMIMDDELIFSRGNSNSSKRAYIISHSILALAIYFIVRAFMV